ncbi:MAG: type II/IV secretion system ATPase subunit [Candidatus Woesearchaeota archaeon]|nr:MAG: type II/IV secretion system ATPase subunit [Candidatus Woesearchaeota archaeon]
MVERKKNSKFQLQLDTALSHYPHLRTYVDEFSRNNPQPKYLTELGFELKREKSPNVIYPVGEPLFIHVLKDEKGILHYIVIEPTMDEETSRLNDKILDRMIEIAHELPVPERLEDVAPILVQLLNKIVVIGEGKTSKVSFSNKIVLSQVQYDFIKYYLLRNRVGFSKLEPIFNDPYLEDIHCVGVGELKVVHKIFEMLRTNVEFSTDLELNKYILETSERVERPVSDARPVVDAVMPDGSRVNFIYGREISREGSSFTIRKFADVPVSIIQVLNFQTMTSEVAAYIWLALEHGMNAFVCGETASGKTTTLNAASVFIKPDAKVYTVENTAEVTMPQDTWQHLVTREAGKDTDVDMFTLLIAALRSRPNYIIVGEIRGVEGNVAFQAMQTGHPVLSTFHAGSVHSMIQRLTGHPIDVPIAFIDNLNIVLIQQAVSVNGRFVRRITSVTEIERYYDAEQKVITRRVFTWDPISDEHRFSGYYNSFLLEKKIAPKMGLADPKEVYDELARRAKILEKMRELKITNYFKVYDVIRSFYLNGIEGLPFEI